MVNYCCVPQCKSKGVLGCGIKFHKFPQSKQMLTRWLRVLKIGRKPTKHTRVCGLHFLETDYKATIYSGYTQRFLKRKSIPTKHLPITNHETHMANCSVNSASLSLIKYPDVIQDLEVVQDFTQDEISEGAGCLQEAVIVQMPALGDVKTSVTSCFVPGCKTKSTNQFGVKFHCFPRDPKLARLWNVKLRSGKMPTKSSRVCNSHFGPDDYCESATIGDTQVLKNNAVPSRNIPNKPIKHLVLLSEPDIQEEPLAPPPIKIPKIEKNDAANQTDMELVFERATQTDSDPIPTETMGYDELSAEDFYFFTGLKLPSFQELTEYLDIDSKSTKYTKSMSNYDQLILTLIELRHKFEFKILAKMYGIHRDIVREIFVLWIKVMFDQFRKTDLWAIRDNGNFGYTAIVLCREIPCQSNNSDFHVILKSEKMKRLTLKYLVATDEQGMVIFCSSQLFGGSIPDRQVITQSGILAKLKNGDKVLSESDFNIDDLIKINGIIFHQPHECSDVSKGRAYVKRVAEMTKIFEMLNGVFPAMLMPYAAIIVYVTNVLVNFVSETEN